MDKQTPEQIEELITRRRRQILVHSCLYYKLGTSLISDNKYDEWAYELDKLQKEFHEIASKCIYAKEFEEYTPYTGINLPFHYPEVLEMAYRLIMIKED